MSTAAYYPQASTVQYSYPQPTVQYTYPTDTYNFQSAPSMVVGATAAVDHSQGRWFAPGEALPPGYVIVAHPDGLVAPSTEPAVTPVSTKSSKKKSSKKKSSGCC